MGLSSQLTHNIPAQATGDPQSIVRRLLTRKPRTVSGSLALQFFERTTWSSSDLDIYVRATGSASFSRYLCEKEGYVLANETNLADDYEDEGNEIAEV